MKSIFLIVAALLSLANPASAACCRDPRKPAFQGATGFGKYANGGTVGGTIYRVNTLNDCDNGTITGLTDCGVGEVSLRWCVMQSGPRVCVFDVSGTIEVSRLGITASDPYLTIAGQTSPNGIQLKRKDNQVDTSYAMLRINTHDVVVRGLRLRPGVGCDSYSGYNQAGTVSCTPGTGKGFTDQSDGIQMASDSSSPDEPHDVILDHVSVGWSTDEDMDLYAGAGGAVAQANSKVRNITIQNVLSSPQLDYDFENGGARNHAFPILSMGGQDVTISNSLAVNTYFRWPNHSGFGVMDFVNNSVVSSPPGYTGTVGYVFRPSPVAGCGPVDPAWNHDPPPVLNARGNWGAQGWNPDPGYSNGVLLYMLCANGSIYDDGANEVDVTADLLQYVEGGGVGGTDTPSAVEFPVPFSKRVVRRNALAARDSTIINAGASWRVTCDGTRVRSRDSLDDRHATTALNRTTDYIIHPSVIGWPDLQTGAPSACIDTDADGLPDDFESRYGVTSATTDDDSDGWTNFEEYLNGTNPI